MLIRSILWLPVACSLVFASGCRKAEKKARDPQPDPTTPADPGTTESGPKTDDENGLPTSRPNVDDEKKLPADAPELVGRGERGTCRWDGFGERYFVPTDLKSSYSFNPGCAWSKFRQNASGGHIEHIEIFSVALTDYRELTGGKGDSLTVQFQQFEDGAPEEGKTYPAPNFLFSSKVSPFSGFTVSWIRGGQTGDSHLDFIGSLPESTIKIVKLPKAEGDPFILELNLIGAYDPFVAEEYKDDRLSVSGRIETAAGIYLN